MSYTFRVCLTIITGLVLAVCSLAQDTSTSEPDDELARGLESLPVDFANDLRATRANVIELQTTEKDPQKRSDAWGNLGMIYHGQQLLDTALDAYRHALAEHEDARWHYLSAVIHLSRGDSETALAYLQQTVLLVPDYTAAWYRIGTIHLMQGEFETAEDAFLEAQKSEPTEAAILVGLADASLELGKTEDAMDYLQRAWTSSPTAGQIAYKLAQIYQEQGDDEKFEEWLSLTKGVRNPPQLEDPLLVEVASFSRNSRFYKKVADWAIQRGDIPSAISAMKSAVAVEPQNTDLSLDYALLLFMAQQREEAVKEVKGVLERDLESSRGWYRLAWMLRQSEDPEQYLEGLVAVRRSLEITDDDRARRLGAAMLIGAGRFEEAEEDYGLLLQKEPENAYYQYWLGMVQLAQNKCAGVNSIKRALVLKRDFGEAHVVLARAEALCGDTDKAIARIEALIGVKDDIDTRLAQAYIHLHAGKMESVKEIAEAALPHPDAQLLLNALDGNEKPTRLFEFGSPWWIPQELR